VHAAKQDALPDEVAAPDGWTAFVDDDDFLFEAGAKVPGGGGAVGPWRWTAWTSG
jgi:hypothetical protein